MRILITGGAGYVGSSLATRLIQIGHHVTVWDRLDHGGEGLLHLIGHPRFTLERSDVFHGTPPEDIDAVCMLAAIVGEPACIEAGPDKTHRDIVLTTAHIAKHYADKPRVFFSTCSNYGITKGVADENSVLKPVGIYAEAKIEAEKVARDYGAVVLRFATICGPSPRPRFDLLVNDIARRAVLGAESHIWGGQCWRPFVHIHDVPLAALAALSLTYPGTFNVVGENWKKGKLAGLARRIFPDAKIYSTEGKDEDPRDYQVDSTLFEEHTGWAAKKTVEQALREVAEQVRLVDSDRRAYRNVAA